MGGVKYGFMSDEVIMVFYEYVMKSKAFVGENRRTKFKTWKTVFFLVSFIVVDCARKDREAINVRDEVLNA